ncbi:MAG: NAD(P)H-hydrate dehydratase [Tissierellaceae bacterium]
MEYLVTSNEMKACDYNTINKIGIPSMVLVERAALGALEELVDHGFDLSRVLVVCGRGNNGADGFALARLLHLKGVSVDILFIDRDKKSTPETSQQISIVQNYGIGILDQVDFTAYTTIVDGLLGVGLSRDVEGAYADIIEGINQSQARVLALDIPSGISADDGKVMGKAVLADKTVTFGFKKLGLVLYPGARYAGELVVKDIGLTEIGFEGKLPKVSSHTPEDMEMLPVRQPYSNKGTFGRVLVVAGSTNMSGAAYLSAKAAYRMGVGLVNIYTVEENREILQTQLPEAILTTYDSQNPDLGDLIAKIQEARVIVVGPGMGRSLSTRIILETVLKVSEVPLVIDADAVNILAENPDLLEDHRQDIILTPHLGEMGRLIKKNTRQISENIIAEAEDFARKKGLNCVLKDTRTVIARRDGQVFLNQSGNDGMATAGSGDVLTGIIAGLIAQGLGSMEAASLGVYIHGLAGDRAAEKLGRHALMAGDIIDSLHYILR